MDMVQNTLIFVLVTLVVFIPVTVCQCSGGEEKKALPPPAHTNIVLVGATGDLAQKYLWNALFELFKKEYHAERQQFTIYGCARSDPNKGRESLSKILLNTVKCSDTTCRDMKMKFVGATQYHQLKTEEHYKALGVKMNENTQSMYGLQDTEFSSEAGRIVYLSIPPGAYVETATWVHKHLRPKYGHPYFRLVLEKPFGRDLDSARELAERLAEMFDEKDLYRIDHYLGKTTVQYILPFRQLNRGAYDSLWNNNHIEQVQIVMKEKHDVKGRIGFYDDIGVIRDVMQNHLTEILALVAMETPQDTSHIGKILQSKVSVLKDTYGFGSSRTLVGQYSTYVSEAVNELNKPEHISTTPTFASTLLNVDNARWSGVPFVLLAGKKLDEKASYVRVVFKQGRFCVNDVRACKETTKPGQVIFWIGSGDVNQPPMVLVSKSLPKPRESGSWRLRDFSLEREVFGMNVSDMYALMPEEEEDAYSNLVRAVFEGQRHFFTSTSSLLASWGFWTPIMNQIKHIQPRTYTGDGVDPTWLDFDVVGNRNLKFVNNDRFLDIPEKVESRSITGLPKTFRDQILVVKGFVDILQVLSDFIVASAEESIAARGSFHFAVSGGRSMPQLLSSLASNYPAFPWKLTHIWQVDERCVDADDNRSNFKLIQQYLLRDVKVVPYMNVHKMYVQFPSGFCEPEDNGAALYEAQLKALTNATLDVVILGIGKDGHTASLFPNSPLLKDYNHLVSVGSAGASSMVSKRMTLTYRALNQARRVAVLVTGAEKHEVVSRLAEAGDDPQTLPITGIKADDVMWFIDQEAWLGKQ